MEVFGQALILQLLFFMKLFHLKLFGTYLNIFALAFSVSEVNGFLQMFVLSGTLIFTIIQIYKALKK